MKRAALALAMSTAIATPAQAFFGPVCIPTLYNCMCTMISPCPVVDPQNLAQEILRNSGLESQLGVMADIKNPMNDMIKAINGQGSFGLPGFDSIGINLNGIIGGDLSSLGIPSIGGDFASQLRNLGIDGNTLNAIARGELGVDHFISVAQGAGLDFNMLSQAGLSVDTITSLASGQLDATSLLNLTQGLNLQAGVLADIGITENMITGIARGEINPDRLLQIAQNAGLDMQALTSVGLDATTIANLPNAGPDFVANVLQRSGFDTSITSSLGLNAGMISQISSGQLPPSAINTLVAGTGIDPNSIVIPGVNGPIRASDPTGSNVPGAGNGSQPSPLDRPTNMHDMISIPIDSVPGLGNTLQMARGESSAAGAFSSPAATTDAMCAADQSLISSGEPPNGFGDDVENIHMAIAGGSIEAFIESTEAAVSVASSTAALGYARTMQVKPIILRAIEAVETFDSMISDARSLQDDIAVNDAIQTRLMTAKAEKASILTSYTSVMAAKVMRERFFSPLPLFPEEGRFRDVVNQSGRSIASQSARQGAEASQVRSTALADYSRLQDIARSALNDYSMIHHARAIEATLPDIIETINNHEDYKSLLYQLELLIIDSLAELYVPADVATAWERLRPQLLASAGDYTNGRKWEEGVITANGYSEELTAQVPLTAYGRRIPVMDLGDTVTFTEAAETAYAYPDIDAHAASNADPYRVRNPMVNPDDGEMPATLALSGLLQYYLETSRREVWTGALRRGDSDRVMTGIFWTEMLNHAPDCLSGPLPTTREALTARPDMFDLDPGCTHLYWSLGDPGDYIDASHLGGADAALWLSKISIDQVMNRTGGEEQVLARLANARLEIEASPSVTLLAMQGETGPSIHIDNILDAIVTASSDPQFSSRAAYPMQPR